MQLSQEQWEFFREGYTVLMRLFLQVKNVNNERIEQLINKNDMNNDISKEDLESYKPYIRSPIVANYRGNKVFTAGPPSGGGITLLTALNILSYFDLSKFKSFSLS